MPVKALFNAPQQRKGRSNFGAALYSARTDKQWSQEHLGLEVGVSQAAVAAWEAGVNVPAPPTVFQLEVRLGLRAGQLSQHLDFLPLGAPRPTKVDVVEAILRSDLSHENKQVLIATYNVMAGLTR